jgi:uncharacterized protein YjbI with pentapeptide repeats
MLFKKNLYAAMKDYKKRGLSLNTFILKGQDLSGKNLSGYDFSGMDMSGIDLFKANLNGAILSGANLADAILTNAKLNKADLVGANLTRTKLFYAELSEANLSKADLSEAGLSHADLSGANLTDTKLIEATMSGTYLKSAIMVKADLRDARLARADLSDANLTGANLTGADLFGADLTGVIGMKSPSKPIIPAQLETITLDEELQVSWRCKDILMLVDNEDEENDEDPNTNAYISAADAFVLVALGRDENDTICYDLESMKQLYNNKSTGWFYECTGDMIKDTNNKRMGSFGTTPYVKIPINLSGFNAFVPADQVLSLIMHVIEDNIKVFYIAPHLDAEGTQQMITHTSSHKNTDPATANYVSANHCQAGSSILIYDIKLCKGDCPVSRPSQLE